MSELNKEELRVIECWHSTLLAMANKRRRSDITIDEFLEEAGDAILSFKGGIVDE